METRKGLTFVRVRNLVAPSSRFSVKRGCSLAPSPLITAPQVWAPPLGCVSGRRSPPDTSGTLCCSCGPAGQGQRARGRDSSSSRDARAPASPETEGLPPEPVETAGGGRDWLETGCKHPSRAPAMAGARPRVSLGAVDEDDANNHPRLAAACLHVGQSAH